MKKFFLFLIIVIILGFLFFRFKKDRFSLLDGTIDNKVFVDKYFVYGNHLNIFGSFDIDSYDSLSLVFKSFDNEISYDLIIDDNSFSTSKYINEGIFLDDLGIDDYFVFLKCVNGDQVSYYNLVNKTKYNDLKYFALSNTKKVIDINYSSYSNKEYFDINVSGTDSTDYYDVVIDAGHGGDDPGASYASHNEADITLDYALALKKSLENLGLRVKLTRDSDVSIDSYGPHSRTGIVYESGAKYVFSIHLNSSDLKLKSGGVEIYSPSGASLDFAKSLAKNIVNSADTNYSNNESFRVLDGVYVRTFTKDDINSSIASARKNGYTPYSIDSDTTYYYMIRETGGIATKAYIDGRDKNYNKNVYFDSNIGAEGYLMELGFINYWGDLNNLVDNKSGYIDGITNAIKDEIGI